MLIINGSQSILVAMSEIIPYFPLNIQNSTELNVFGFKWQYYQKFTIIRDDHPAICLLLVVHLLISGPCIHFRCR
jgi:hypothetical protein